jgi:sortase B
MALRSSQNKRSSGGYQRLDSSYTEGYRAEVHGRAAEGCDPYAVQGDPYGEPRKKKGTGLLVAAVLLLVVGLGLLGFAGYTWYTNQQAYQENADEYHGLAEAYVVEGDADGDDPVVVDFAALKALNSEIVGWVLIPNTPVNYPVVQHNDNDYYLTHSFLGRYDEFGAVFMDYRSDPYLADYTTVLYGHHLKNGEMFAKVADYSNQADFDTLNNLYYVSQDGVVHTLAPLCAVVVSGYDVDVLQFYFDGLGSFQTYVQSLLDRSSARSATADASTVGHLYLLSTCSYATDNERTILVCTDLNATNGAVVDATQSLEQIQESAAAAADAA